MSDEIPRYWDVAPKQVRISQNDEGVSIPIAVRGDPKGEIFFESADHRIARIDEGRLVCGEEVGATLIVVYDSEARDSARYIHVEILAGQTGGGGY